MHRLERVAALLLSGLFAVSMGAEVPDRMESVGHDHMPVAWLSEEAIQRAMAERGQPEGSRLQSVAHLFRDTGDAELELSWSLGPREFQIAPDGTLICEPKPLSYYWGDQATDIPGLIELSRAIVLVRVVDSKSGFASGEYAGELLEVEVVRVFKDAKHGDLDDLGPAPTLPRDGFYLFDYYARMVIDGRAVCLGARQVPRGEFFLFMTGTRPNLFMPLPVFGLDAAALISADGSFYGNLLDRSAAQEEEIARQLANEQILSRRR